MRPSIIFATAEYVKRLREECLRENKPLHRHTRFRRQELALRIPLYSITDWHRSPISDSHPFDQPGT